MPGEAVPSPGEALSIPADGLSITVEAVASAVDGALSIPVEAVASAGETLASGFRLLEPPSAPFGVPGATLPLHPGVRSKAPQATETARGRRAAFIGTGFMRQRETEP